MSALYLSASRTGRRLSSAVSLGSLNQDLMGMALSVVGGVRGGVNGGAGCGGAGGRSEGAVGVV